VDDSNRRFFLSKLVRWVERSEIHHLRGVVIGFASFTHLTG